MTAFNLRATVVSGQRLDGWHAETAEPRWKGLYTIGGVAALVTVALIPLQVVAFVLWPPPLNGPVTEWFTLFQSNWLIGLLSLDLLLLVDYVLLIPIVLALYAALRRAAESLMAIGIALFFVAIALYFASNTAFEMLALSGQYATATTDGQRATYLAAGQAMLATYQGTAFHVSYILASIAGIIVTAVMLRSQVFSRVAAVAGLLGYVVGLALYLPIVGIFLSVLSAVVLWIWYALVGWRLLQLGRRGPEAAAR